MCNSMPLLKGPGVSLVEYHLISLVQYRLGVQKHAEVLVEASDQRFLLTIEQRMI